jgi:hypothetical protein
VISTLRGQRLTLQRWMAPPEKQAGAGGLSTVANVESIPGSTPAPTSDKARYSWVLPPGLELDSSGKGWQVGSQMVEKAICHVAQARMLAGYNNPRHTHHSCGELDIRLTNMLKTYKDSDPVPRPQVALPVATSECSAAAHQRDDGCLSNCASDRSAHHHRLLFPITRR